MSAVTPPYQISQFATYPYQSTNDDRHLIRFITSQLVLELKENYDYSEREPHGDFFLDMVEMYNIGL